MIDRRWRCLPVTAGVAIAASMAIAQRSVEPDPISGAAKSAGDAKAQPSEAFSPAFEVATVKPAASSADGHTHINYPSDGRFSAINIPLLELMGWAYGMPKKQILEGPSWLGSTHFDIQAKSDAETDGELRKLSPDQGLEVKRRMVQALLADRFNLKVHGETRVLPSYDLLLAKGGSKLQVSHANGKSLGIRPTSFDGESLTTTIIAEQLSQIAGRVVVDKTNLTGRYDLKLQWSADEAPVTEDSAPSLFTAIQEQLGLKLEPAKDPVAVLILDHVELPSAN